MSSGLEYSPLFSFFDLSLPYNSEFKLFKENTILVNYIDSQEFSKDREKTLIGKLAKGTKYENYALKNEIVGKNNNYIEKKKASSRFSFGLIYNNVTYGIWNDFKEGKIYVSQHYIDNGYIFAFNLKDLRPNTMLINAMKQYRFWKLFIDNFNMR